MGATMMTRRKERRTLYRMSNELKFGIRTKPVLTFDLHPLYASILKDGATVREGEVLGLDAELRRVVVAPFAGTMRLLITGQGDERCVKVFLTENESTVTARRPAPFTVRDAANYLHESRN